MVWWRSCEWYFWIRYIMHFLPSLNQPLIFWCKSIKGRHKPQKCRQQVCVPLEADLRHTGALTVMDSGFFHHALDVLAQVRDGQLAFLGRSEHFFFVHTFA